MADAPSDAVGHPRQGQAWNAEEDRQLYDGFVGGHSIATLTAAHKRSAGAIRSRLGRLGLIDQNGEAVQPVPPFAAAIRRPSTTSGAPRSAAVKDAVRSVFAVNTADGWVVEINSNRPLDKPLVERLTVMLHAVLSAQDKG